MVSRERNYRGKVIGKKEKCEKGKVQCLEAKVQSVYYWSAEIVRCGKYNTVFLYRTVLFLKIPYVIPYRTFCQNRTVP